MMVRPAIIWLLVILLTACGANHTAKSAVIPHPNRDGVYVVYYAYYQMIDDYGPGVEHVRNTISQIEDTKEKLAVWDRALAIAVPKYMEVNNLIPPECVHGVTIIGSSGDRSGGGASAFRCK